MRRLLLVVGLVATLLVPARVNAQPWPKLAKASIHPGVAMTSPAGACTSNFIYRDPNGLYIGFAAHCLTQGSPVGANGCNSPTFPLGTKVNIEGASKPGVVVYSSWIAMQKAKESDTFLCILNDLGLVKIDPADVGKVNPSVPFWGGPTSLDTNGTTELEALYSYGNSPLREGIEQLKPKAGYVMLPNLAERAHSAYFITPGIPGDSGSAVLSSTGQALGVLAAISGLPPASNIIGDLDRELAYAHKHGMSHVQLMPGTKPFVGDGAAGLLRVLLET